MVPGDFVFTFIVEMSISTEKKLRCSYAPYKHGDSSEIVRYSVNVQNSKKKKDKGTQKKALNLSKKNFAVT